MEKSGKVTIVEFLMLMDKYIPGKNRPDRLFNLCMFFMKEPEGEIAEKMDKKGEYYPFQGQDSLAFKVYKGTAPLSPDIARHILSNFCADGFLECMSDLDDIMSEELKKAMHDSEIDFDDNDFDYALVELFKDILCRIADEKTSNAASSDNIGQSTVENNEAGINGDFNQQIINQNPFFLNVGGSVGTINYGVNTVNNYYNGKVDENE